MRPSLYIIKNNITRTNTIQIKLQTMQNLTTKQQTIIANITNEFAKINEEKNNRPKSSLFDIDGLLYQKERDTEDKEQIKLNNLLFDEMLKSIIEQDMEKLNFDLNQYGLTAYFPKHWDIKNNRFIIDTIKQMNAGIYDSANSIDLSYELEYVWMSFESNISPINKKSQKYRIGCYVNSNNKKFYNNLDEFAKDTIVIHKIKNLLNK